VSLPIAGHREQRADGCPSAALLDEVVRRPPATKKVFSGGLMSIVDEIASRLDPIDVEAARADALTLYGLLIGTLQLARSLTDRDLSGQILAGGVDAALKLLD
jgi:TetR/AcrR family transcriptional regulator, transcriptional repressor for nem operon